MGKRTYGSGSLHWRAERGTWRASFEAGWTTTGKRRRITVSAKTKTEALRKLEKAKRDYQQGLLNPNSDPNVKQLANQWLEARKHQIKPKAYTVEKSALEKHIIPLLGTRKLSTLRPQDLQNLATRIQQTGLAPSTAARYQGVLLAMLNSAEKNGLTVPRAILAADKQKINDPNRYSIPIEDTIRILHTAAQTPGGAQWMLALLEGMRRSEILGLRWQDINFNDYTIDLRWQLQPLPYNKKNDPSSGFRTPYGYECIHLTGAYHLVELKSKHSKRLLPLLPWVADTLKQHRQETPENPWGLVFTGSEGGPMPEHSASRGWKRLQDAANVHKTDGAYYVLHEARHTTATLLLAAGIEPEIIKTIMGHSEIVTQTLYQHVDMDMARQALTKMSGLLTARPGGNIEI